MQRLFDRIAQQADALGELADELEARLQTIVSEARDELEEVEWRAHHFENDLLRLRDELRGPATEVARSARALACEAARGCTEVAQTVEKVIEQRTRR